MTAPPHDPRRLGWILAIVSGAAFVDFLDVTVVNLTFPDLRADFGGAGVGDLAWVITGYAVTFAALLTPAGRIADLAGRRRVFLAGTVLFALASLASAIAPSLEVLIAARLVQGAAAALTLPAGLGIVLAAAPPERRAAAIGVWSAAAAVAAIIGPTVGGLLVETVGWRAVFLINLPIGVAIIVGTLRLVEPSPPTATRMPDIAGAMFGAAGIGLVVLAVTQAPEWGWTSTATIAAGAAGAAAVAFALVRSRHHPAPAVETVLWRNRTFATANAASVLMGGAIYAWMLVCVLFMTGVWGYSEIEAGLAFTPGAVSAAITAALIGRRLETGGQRLAVVGGSALLAADGLWLVLALDQHPAFLSLWLPAGLLAGVAMGAMSVGISTAATGAVPPDRFAAATGLNLTARQVGGALAIATLAAILQAGLPQRGIDPYLEVFALCAALSLAAAALALRLEPGGASAPRLVEARA